MCLWVEARIVRDYAPAVATVGENIVRLRKLRGWRQKDLAEKLKMHQGDLSNLEKDKRGLPEAPTLLRLAKAIKCSVDELLQGVDPEYDRIVAHRLPSGSAIPGGPAHGDSSPGDLERRLEAHAVFFKQVQSIAGQLVRATNDFNRENRRRAKRA